MLNYNIEVNFITYNNEAVELGRYRYNNPHNLTAITYTKLVYQYREYQKRYEGYIEINLVEEIDGNIVVLEVAHNVNVRVDISVVFANPGAMNEQGK